jgi:hypothetical protein
MTCACARDIAIHVLPHQARRGIDQQTRAEVPVTHPLAAGVCFDCRNLIPPPYPRARIAAQQVSFTATTGMNYGPVPTASSLTGAEIEIFRY